MSALSGSELGVWFVCLALAGCGSETKRELEQAREEFRDVDKALRSASREMKDVAKELGQAARSAGQDIGREAEDLRREIRALARDLQRLSEQRSKKTPAQEPVLAQEPVPRPVPKPPVRCEGETCWIRPGLVEELRRDPSALLPQARIQSVGDGDRGGLRIDRIRPGSLPAQLGFRNGDVVTAIDGRPVRSFADVVELPQPAAGAEAVELTIRRGRQSRRLILRLEP